MQRTVNPGGVHDNEFQSLVQLDIHECVHGQQVGVIEATTVYNTFWLLMSRYFKVSRQ